MTMATTGSAKLTLPSDTEILMTREFAAPARLVWKAYTTPELVAQWWGGKRGNVTICEIDLRVGGKWRYVMTANQGFEVGFHGEYREIAEHERLVYTEVFEGMPDGDSEPALNLVTFHEADGRTTLEMLTQVSSKEVRDMIIDSGMEGGAQEGLDLLEQIALRLAVDGDV
jgi:uncharacterized protein YndB with AHSA1/START domain